MKRIRNNTIRFVVITLALFGVIGTSTAVTALASPSQRAVQTVDFDGDGKTDVALFDATLARWFTYDFYTGMLNQYDIGTPGDRQVVGDYDGDGMSDFAVCYDMGKPRSKMWQISYSTYGPEGDISWGRPGDIPVPADYDGDGRTDIAVFRPASGVWYLRLSRDKSTRVEKFGYASDKLVPADYDGDGLVDIAVMRPEANEWYVLFSSDRSIQTIAWDVKSMTGDVMVPADYDGDRRADVAVYRGDSGLWIILETMSGNYRSAQFGNGIYSGDPTQADFSELNLDLPMPGDFDGDSIIDIAVWNSKSWVVNVLPSSSSMMSSIPVGTESSIPVSLSVVSQYHESNIFTFR